MQWLILDWAQTLSGVIQNAWSSSRITWMTPWTSLGYITRWNVELSRPSLGVYVEALTTAECGGQFIVPGATTLAGTTVLASFKDRESTEGVTWGLIVVIQADVETPFISNRKWQWQNWFNKLQVKAVTESLVFMLKTHNTDYICLGNALPMLEELLLHCIVLQFVVRKRHHANRHSLNTAVL